MILDEVKDAEPGKDEPDRLLHGLDVHHRPYSSVCRELNVSRFPVSHQCRL